MKASDTQVGGKHYKDMVIQPAEFCQRNRLNWCEANVVKYICRHADKKGAEDLLKAKHYIDLLLEWEYSPAADTSNPIVKNATAASLCLSCGRDPGCVGDYPRTKDGGCEGYISALRENMLDAKQEAVKTLTPKHPLDCVTSACEYHKLASLRNCDKYPASAVSMCNNYEPLDPFTPTAKQAPPTAADLPLDFTLPSITLKCTAEEAHRKYCEENAEWLTAKTGSMEELVERWDCLQALRTYAERGGDTKFCQEEEHYICHDLTAYHAKGRDVIGAKEVCLVKNADRGYYSRAVNKRIMQTEGTSFTPKEADA